ncbi:hypothetical protein [Kytococcus sp. Marseille-QA3725]
MSHVTGGQPGPYAYHPQQQPRRRGLMPLILGGLTLLVGTPLAFLLPIAIGMGDLFGALLNPASEGDTRYLPGGEERILYAVDQDASAVDEGACSVTDPSGKELPLEHRDLAEGGGGPENFWAFRTTEDGDYTFRCGPDAVMAIAPGDALDGIVGWSVAAFLLALLAFLLGFGLIIWGIVQLVRTGRSVQAKQGAHGATPHGFHQHTAPHDHQQAGAPGTHAPHGATEAYRGTPHHGPGQDGGTGQAPDPRRPHPLSGTRGRPAPQYGQYAPGYEPQAEESIGEGERDGRRPGGAHRG